MRIFRTSLIILFGLPLLLNAQTAIRIPMGQDIDQVKELPVSELVEDIQYIALETTPDCLLDQDISKIELFNHEIFISDYKFIYRFDIHGKFLKKIGKQGRGPGEYASMGFQTFLIDRQNQQLLIFDFMSEKMIVYDFEGNYLRSKSIDFLPGPMEWINKENFAVYNMGFTYEPEPWKDFYILNRNARTVGRHVFVRQPKTRYGLVIYPPIFYTFKEKTRYKNPHENTIFEIDGSKIPKPVYFLDLGKYEKYSDVDDVEVRVKNNVGTNRANPKSYEKIGLLGLSETESHLFICYVHQEQRMAGVFDKKSKTFYQLLEKESGLYGLKDDLYGGPPLFPENGISSGVLYSHFAVSDLKEYVNGASNVDPALREIINAGNDNDNPVVVIATLKN
jgi:hypothetical protein